MNISLSDIGKRYNNHWLFHNLNYSFQAGQSYALLGKNGSGKSTLMQIIYGYLMPTTGKIEYSGHNGIAVAPERMALEIAFASPYMQPVNEYTLNELLPFHYTLRKPAYGYTLKQVQEALEISDYDASKPLKYFSSGMQQRIKTGLCLLTESPVKLLDEPLTNIDKSGEAWYNKLVADLPGDTLVIVASNDEAEYSFCKQTLQLA